MSKAAAQYDLLPKMLQLVDGAIPTQKLSGDKITPEQKQRIEEFQRANIALKQAAKAQKEIEDKIRGKEKVMAVEQKALAKLKEGKENPQDDEKIHKVQERLLVAQTQHAELSEQIEGLRHQVGRAQEAVETLSPKQKSGAQVSFTQDELRYARELSLFNALSEPARSQLHKLTTFEDASQEPESASAAASQSISQPQPLSDPIVVYGDKMATTLAYLALANNDEHLIRNFEPSLQKCKQMFGDNHKKLRAYVDNYGTKLKGSRVVVTIALSEASIAPDQPPLSETWQRLLVEDEKRVIPKLLKEAPKIDAQVELNKALIADLVAPAPTISADFESKEDALPAAAAASAVVVDPELTVELKGLNDVIKVAARLNLPKVFERIDSLTEDAENNVAKNDVKKSDVRRLAQEMYKLDLVSHNTDADKDIPLEDALNRAIDTITRPDVKTKATDQMPELNLSYNQVMLNEFQDINAFLSGAQGAAAATPSLDPATIDASPEEHGASVAAADSKVANSRPDSKKDYYLRKLEPNDLRGFYLGKLTNCCQSIDGNSREAVRHGMSQPDSGFYVIQETNSRGERDPNGDRIVSAMWAWRGKDGKSLVFDSFERLGPEHEKLCRPFVKAAAQELLSLKDASGEPQYTYVGLGVGGNTTNLSSDIIETPVLMRKANGFKLNKGLLYGDSRNQYDASKLPKIASISELHAAGYLNTDEALENVIQYMKGNDKKINFEAEALQALSAENGDLFNKLVKAGALDVSQYFGLEEIRHKITPKIMKSLIDAGADVGARNHRTGETILHSPSVLDSVEMVHMLIENGVDVNTVDGDGNTPLHKALETNAETAKVLIKNGADIKIAGEEGRTPLHFSQSSEMTELLIKHGADVNAVDQFGRTPLHFSPSSEMTELLIKHRADVNAVDQLGRTPLHYALQDKAMTVAESLIEHDANPNAADQEDKTPLRYALDINHLEIARLLIKNGSAVHAIDSDGKTLLSHALEGNKTEMAKLFIENGADVNQQLSSDFQYNLLHQALESNNPEMAKLLIEHGADVNAVDQLGRTPLHLAIMLNNPEITKLIVDKGVNVNAVECNNLTPLYYALGSDKPEIAKTLVEHGANVNVVDSAGKTLLQLALENNKSEMTKTLIEYGADVGVVNRDNKLLHSVLIDDDKAEIAKLLIIKKLVDLEAPSVAFQTPLQRAIDNNKTEIAKLLIENGADVNGVGRFGKFKPLYFALLRGNEEIAKMLLADQRTDISGFTQENSAHQSSIIYNMIVAERKARSQVPPLSVDASAGSSHRDLRKVLSIEASEARIAPQYRAPTPSPKALGQAAAASANHHSRRGSRDPGFNI